MNLELYFYAIAITVVLALNWRNILADYPSLLNKVSKIPLVGKAMVCSFCYPQWIALFVTLTFNPIITNANVLITNIPLSNMLIDWLAVSFAVLLVRPLISLIMDMSAVYKHKHLELHK